MFCFLPLSFYFIPPLLMARDQLCISVLTVQRSCNTTLSIAWEQLGVSMLMIHGSSYLIFK